MSFTVRCVWFFCCQKKEHEKKDIHLSQTVFFDSFLGYKPLVDPSIKRLIATLILHVFLTRVFLVGLVLPFGKKLKLLLESLKMTQFAVTYLNKIVSAHFW